MFFTAKAQRTPRDAEEEFKGEDFESWTRISFAVQRRSVTVADSCDADTATLQWNGMVAMSSCKWLQESRSNASGESGLGDSADSVCRI